MNTLIALTVCLVVNSVNPISKLEATEDVEVFLASLSELKGANLSVASQEELLTGKACSTDHLGTLNIWTLLDVNGDQRSDLLVHVKEKSKVYPIVVLSNEDGTLSIQKLEFENFDPYLRAMTSTLADSTLISLIRFKAIYTFDTADTELKPVVLTLPRVDTLTFTDHGLIEYQPRLDEKEVRSIKFEHLGCEAFCPKYTIELDLFGELVLHRQSNFNPRENHRWATYTIPETLASHYLRLATLIAPKQYGDKYAAEGTQERVRISLTLSDFTVKTIYDVGLSSSIGLQMLYRQFITWHNEANWKKYRIEKH